MLNEWQTESTDNQTTRAKESSQAEIDRNNKFAEWQSAIKKIAKETTDQTSKDWDQKLTKP